jgi:hypothetical protein
MNRNNEAWCYDCRHYGIFNPNGQMFHCNQNDCSCQHARVETEREINDQEQ